MSAPAVWLIDSLRLGGAERLALETACAASADGGFWPPRLVVLQTAGPAVSLEAEARARGVDCWCAQARHLRDYAAWRRLARYLRALRPCLLHAHLGYAILWGAALARELRLPWVATLHVLPRQSPCRRARLLEWLEVRALNAGARRVFAVGDEQRRRWLAAGLRPSLVRLLPNGVAAPVPLAAGERLEFRQRWRIPAAAPLFLTVAAVRPDKGWRDWLRLCSLVAVRLPAAVFAWVGDGPDGPRLRAAAALRPELLCAGQSQEVAAWLAAADCFLFPSRLEALPTVLLEAMAAALPIVAFDLPANREVLADAGCLVAGGDLAAFAAAAAALAASPERARPLAAAARRRYLVEYSAERWRERLAAEYRQVLARAAPGLAA